MGSEMCIRDRMKLVMDDSLLGSFTRVTVEESSFMGALMFPGRTLDDVWSSRCADLTLACDRLGLVSSQDALSLLRLSAHPRFSTYCVSRLQLT